MWESFFISMSAQAKPGDRSSNTELPQKSFCIFHCVSCTFSIPAHQWDFSSPSADNPYFPHTQSSVQEQKMGRGKMIKCRLQLLSFQPLPLPTTLFASLSRQLSTQGHRESLLAPVPRPGVSIYTPAKQREPSCHQ